MNVFVIYISLFMLHLLAYRAGQGPCGEEETEMSAGMETSWAKRGRGRKGEREGEGADEWSILC